MKRLGWAFAALAVASCAGPVKSTLAPPAAPADAVGVPAPAVGADAAEAQSARVQAELERRLMTRDWGVPLQVSRGPDGTVRLRMGADESFERATAQLDPRAMLVLTEAASVVRQAPASVLHVLAHGDDPGSERATSLSARRAASVQSYLVTRGLPPARLRAEGRGAREPASTQAADPANWRIELVIRPVIAGREAEAWMPPAALQSCEPCNASP
jgi:outer membrane protein OmpA-like peptidoglycan-associated protein